MVQLSCIYTRSGDKGTTSLVNGQRVAKDHLRVEAYGTVDEANSVIGVARLHTTDSAKAEDAMLARIQQDLFDLGADLATPPLADEKPEQALRILPRQVERLEQEIDRMNATLAPLASFVLPGGTAAAAQLHVARTIIRRAERQVVSLQQLETVNPQALIYLNRLSDHLFVLARYLNAQVGGDVLWQPGSNR
jgi:cob(I)alamin adenosyltransferase